MLIADCIVPPSLRSTVFLRKFPWRSRPTGVDERLRGEDRDSDSSVRFATGKHYCADLPDPVPREGAGHRGRVTSAWRRDPLRWAGIGRCQRVGSVFVDDFVKVRV